MRIQSTVVLFLFAFLLSCRQEIVTEEFKPTHDHEAYAYNLKQANLEHTLLGRNWLESADKALQEYRTIALPAAEVFYFSEKETPFLTYRFAARRGEEIEVQLDVLEQNSDTALHLFVDVFRVPGATESPVHVASLHQPSRSLVFEPREDRDYLLRIQPELLLGGRFQLSIEKGPRLSFPVQGGRNYDIGSFFGDPRDGGRRRHHGIDIFAKRHTPILAPCDGHIRFAGTKGLGGNVVWMRNDDQKLTLYFAHLHDIIAKDDMWVQKGDTLGTVGNTGNARTTPPHLHFGIYARGPIDPYAFVALQPQKARKVSNQQYLLGEVLRTQRRTKFININGQEQVEYLSANAWIFADSIDDRYLQVRLADGRRGRVLPSAVEIASEGLAEKDIPDRFDLREDWHPSSTLIAEFSSKAKPQILAMDGQDLFLRTADGRQGWTTLTD